MEKLSWSKGFLYLMVLLLYAMGVIGGIGYSIYNGAYPIAVGVAVTGWLAFPKVKEIFKTIFL